MQGHLSVFVALAGNGDTMIRKHCATLFALAFVGVYFFLVFGLGVELFEFLVRGLAALERYNVDEFLFPVMAVAMAMLIDMVRKERNDAIEVEKAKIYRAMIFSLHHVMNNFLNQMRLFKMTADATPGFDAKILALYDAVIAEALTQIEALGAIGRIDENAIKLSVAPKSRAKSRIQQEP